MAVEFRFRFNKTLLKVVNVTEGPFLKEFAGYPHQGTYFIYVTRRIMFLWELLFLPDEHGTYYKPFPSRSGTIVSITFESIYQHMGLEKPPPSCDLELFSTKIAD